MEFWKGVGIDFTKPEWSTPQLVICFSAYSIMDYLLPTKRGWHLLGTGDFWLLLIAMLVVFVSLAYFVTAVGHKQWTTISRERYDRLVRAVGRR